MKSLNTLRPFYKSLTNESKYYIEFEIKYFDTIFNLRESLVQEDNGN